MPFNPTYPPWSLSWVWLSAPVQCVPAYTLSSPALNKMVKSPYNCVSCLLTQPQVADQEKKLEHKQGTI